MSINEDGDLKYMKSVMVHNSDDGRWLRWMDAICFPEYEPFEFEETNWFLLEYDGKYVGYSGWRKVNDDVGELCRAGIIPDWRGNNFHRHMIRWRERNMKDRGISISIATVYANNPNSMNNLIACGYKVCSRDEWPTVQSSENSAVYFKKKL